MALDIQLQNFIVDMRSDTRFVGLKGIGELAVKLVETDKHVIYRLVYLLVTLVLTLPVATASVERSFSAMKYIKSNLRNRMGDQWMNDCLVTYIESDVFDTVDNEAIMQRFQNMKTRRGQFEVRVEGLETLDYLDNLLQRKRLTEQADAITFDGEIDRVYLHTPANIAVIDHEKKRTFVLHKEGLPDAVVWNPWEKTAKAIPDLGDQDYKNMLYVCSAAVENPIVLKPMDEWKGRQELSAVSSSYCSGQLDPQKVLLYSKLAEPQQ